MSILAAEETHNPLLPPLGEIIIGLIAFAVVMIVFFRFVAPRFEQVFRARREAIEGGIERAEAMQAEAKAALEQYRAQLADDLAGRVVGESLEDDARRRGTVDRFLDQLDGMTGGGAPDGRTGSTVFV